MQRRSWLRARRHLVAVVAVLTAIPTIGLMVLSWQLLRQELITYYEAFRQGRDLELAPSPSYGGYIAWLHEQDEEERIHGETS